MTLPYDDGYAACPCFWGVDPGSLVLELEKLVPSFTGYRVLDVGCGEGKNAVFLGERGATVRAIDCSELALQNAQAAWKSHPAVQWEQADIRRVTFEPMSYDVVVAYGVLHCLTDAADVQRIVRTIQAATKPRGFNLVCSFNDRAQELSAAHPGFSPTLLAHDDYQRLYEGWTIIVCSDADLNDIHPHNRIPHTHSMTRLLARKS